MLMKKTAYKLTDQLRQLVRDSGKTLGEISREAGVDKTALSRFLNCERGVSCEMMDTLGQYLGLRIMAKKPRKKKGR